MRKLFAATLGLAAALATVSCGGNGGLDGAEGSMDETTLKAVVSSLPLTTLLSSAKLTNDTFLALPYGIGIKQGNVAMKRWVDSRLTLMKQQDRFMAILRNNVPARFVQGFSKNILRPNNTFGYAPAGSPSADTVCP